MSRWIVLALMLVAPLTSGCLYGVSRNYKVVVVPQTGMNHYGDDRVQVEMIWLRNADLNEMPLTYSEWLDYRQMKGPAIADLLSTKNASPKNLERLTFGDKVLAVPSQYPPQEFYGFRVFADYSSGGPEATFTYEAKKTWFPSFGPVEVSVYLNENGISDRREAVVAEPKVDESASEEQ